VTNVTTPDGPGRRWLTNRDLGGGSGRADRIGRQPVIRREAGYLSGW